MLVDSSPTYQRKSIGCPAKFGVCDVSEMVGVKWIAKCLPTEQARRTTSCSIYVCIACYGVRIFRKRSVVKIILQINCSIAY